MNLFIQNVRYGWRMLRKNPGFTVIALLTLALGIGANTALFSVIDAVLLKPLPFHDPGRLVAARSVDPKDSTMGGEISYPNFLDWRSQSHSFEDMSVWNTTDVTYTDGSHPESVHGAVVSGNLFSLLGVSPLLGRTFTSGDDQLGNQQLPVMLSFEFWQSHFGGDRNIVGGALTLDGQKCTVAGVMPPRFQFPVQGQRVELWTTIARDLQGKNSVASQRGVAYLMVLARLKPGIEMGQAKSDLEPIQQRLNREHPDDRPKAVEMQSESESITGAIRPALLILLGAVGFVLLIACANVANLLLARATARQKELIVRSALGASRWKIVQQLLTESLMLALMGGAFGILVARWAVSGLVNMAPEGLPRIADIGLDFRVLAFTFVISLITGVLFGLAPALQVFRSDLVHPLGDSGRGTSVGPSAGRVRAVLVVSQLTVAFILLTGAGLLLRSFDRLRHVDPGFRSDHLLTFLLEVPPQRHPRPQRAMFVRQLLDSTRTLLGVKAASAIFGLPLNSDVGLGTTLEIEGRPLPPSEHPRVAFRLIESRYFQTMGIRLLQGRSFTLEDEQGEHPLAIVNQTLAQKLFPGENPIGKHIKASISFGTNGEVMREIVGVVGDVKSNSIAGEADLEVYAPQTPTDFLGVMTIVVRTATDPASLVPSLRALVTSMDKETPLRDVKTMDEYVSASISTPRFEAVLLGVIAGLAFVLTAIGLYGVISYSVAQRMREMGIRVALGAQRGTILGMVVRQGALLAAIGAAAGLAASFFATQLVKSQLYGIGATDPITFAAVPVLLMGVALLASYVPARRATRVDPIVVLREE